MKILIALFVALYAIATNAQTPASCLPTNPCAPLSVSGPLSTTATIYKCGGTCTAASLAAYLANPASTNQWVIIGTFTQTVSPRAYNDPEAYGSQWSYAATNQPSGGAVGAPSAIATFQFPKAPQTPTTLTVGASVVTTGTTGPQ